MSVFRKVVNLGSGDGRKIVCAWDDCLKDGYEVHKVRQHSHSRAVPCDMGEHVTFVFCSERHRQMWLYANNPHFRAPGEPVAGERIAGRLPTGSRGIIG